MVIAPEYSDDYIYPDLNISNFTVEFDAIDKTKIKISVFNGSGNTKSYKVMYVLDTETFLSGSPTVNSNSSTISITGLLPGKSYKILVRGFSAINQGGNFGNSVEKIVFMPIQLEPAKVVTTITGSQPTTTAANNTFGWSVPDYLKPTIPFLDATGSGDTGSGTSGTSGAVTNSGTIVNPKNDDSIGLVDTTVRSLKEYSDRMGLSANVPRGVLLVPGPLAIKTISNFNVSHKDFLSVNNTLPASDNDPVYNTFGTTIFFDDQSKNPNQRGGFGFYFDESKQNGYFLQIRTTVDAVRATAPKEVSFFKVVDRKLYPLSDSQGIDLDRIAGIYRGQTYKIDIKVKSAQTYVEIVAYINGFKITAIDTASSKNTIISPSKTIAAFSYAQTNTYLDYVYARGIVVDEWTKQDSVYGVYNGSFSKNILDTSFGSNILDTEDLEPSDSALEEFGTMAREIRKVKVRYNSRPGNPVYVSTGLSKLAKVIGEKLTSFGAEIYVLNNSSAFIPLEDGDENSFFVLGTTISKTGEYEQSSTKLSEFTVEEPIVFASNWIQSLPEAAALETWIKDNWSSKQITVSMKVFGNPFISVGDVIKIYHSYQSLDGSREFVVLTVDHQYDQGLETSIICRTL
jgi:hypothetical protein